LLVVAAASAATLPDFLRDPLPRQYKLRARWRGGLACATQDGPTIAGAPTVAHAEPTVAVLEHARSRKVRILHTGDRLTIALWVDRDALAPVTTTQASLAAVRSEPMPSDHYGARMMFAARAIPAGTYVYGASNGSPIGVSRDWVEAIVHRSRDGWSEVTLDTELTPLVWVRSEQIAHLR